MSVQLPLSSLKVHMTPEDWKELAESIDSNEGGESKFETPFDVLSS